VQAVAHEPVAASTRVDPLLRGRVRRTEVLAVFPTALYLGVDAATVVPVVAADGLPLPGSVLLPRPSGDLTWAVRQGEGVDVGRARVVLPDRVLTVVRTWRPPRTAATGLRPSARADIESAGGGVGDALLRECARIVARTALHSPRDLADHVVSLVGAGRGLTPSGDDALCGVLLTLRAGSAPSRSVTALADAVRAASRRTTGLSATLLRDAADGYAVPPVSRMLALLATTDDVAPAVCGVLDIGASSGADLLAGVLGALDALAEPMLPSSTSGTSADEGSGGLVGSLP
jgi:hypothetical protein